jgi:hypothetical protein
MELITIHLHIRRNAPFHRILLCRKIASFDPQEDRRRDRRFLLREDEGIQQQLICSFGTSIQSFQVPSFHRSTFLSSFIHTIHDYRSPAFNLSIVRIGLHEIHPQITFTFISVCHQLSFSFSSPINEFTVSFIRFMNNSHSPSFTPSTCPISFHETHQ